MDCKDQVTAFEDFRDRTMFFVVYGVISQVFRDQTMLFVIPVDDVIFPEVFHDQTLVFTVHVDCGVFSDISMFISK